MVLLSAALSLAALAAQAASPAVVVDDPPDDQTAKVHDALNAGSYSEGETLARRLVQGVRLMGPGAEGLAGAQELLAEALLLGGKSTTPEAVDAAQEALAATETRFGPRD